MQMSTDQIRKFFHSLDFSTEKSDSSGAKTTRDKATEEKPTEEKPKKRKSMKRASTATGNNMIRVPLTKKQTPPPLKNTLDVYNSMDKEDKSDKGEKSEKGGDRVERVDLRHARKPLAQTLSPQEDKKKHKRGSKSPVTKQIKQHIRNKSGGGSEESQGHKKKPALNEEKTLSSLTLPPTAPKVKPRSSRIFPEGLDKAPFNPITEYKLDDTSLVVPTIEEAILPLTDLVPDIQTYLQKSKEDIHRKLHPDSEVDQNCAIAIHLYTSEWKEANQSLYYTINSLLREKQKTPKIEPFLSYIRLLYKALKDLPPYDKDEVIRVVSIDAASPNFELAFGHVYPWYSFTSCTASGSFPTQDETQEFATIFRIKTYLSGRDISSFSQFENEKEVVLLPGVNVKIIAVAPITKGVRWINMEEMYSRSQLSKLLHGDPESIRFWISLSQNITEPFFQLSYPLKKLIFSLGKVLGINYHGREPTADHIGYRFFWYFWVFCGGAFGDRSNKEISAQTFADMVAWFGPLPDLVQNVLQAGEQQYYDITWTKSSAEQNQRPGEWLLRLQKKNNTCYFVFTGQKSVRIYRNTQTWKFYLPTDLQYSTTTLEELVNTLITKSQLQKDKCNKNPRLSLNRNLTAYTQE